MDDLELLKAKWQEREQELPTLSYTDIYKMLLQKSSSIVKWIFVISIAEILFWVVLGLLMPDNSKELLENIGLQKTLNITYVAHYVIILFFLILFYLNWRNIKVTDTVKSLMKSILNTRRTVKYFVVYNVFGTVILFVFINIYFYTKQTELYSLLSKDDPSYAAIPKENFLNIFFISQLVAGVLFIGFILVLYRIIYGILLKRLKGNYDELERIEV